MNIPARRLSTIDYGLIPMYPDRPLDSRFKGLVTACGDDCETCSYDCPLRDNYYFLYETKADVIAVPYKANH